MPEYIDRQKLLKALSYEGTCRSKNSESPDLLRGLVIAILVAQKEVETVDVAEVKHAHWTHIVGYDPRDAWVECSRCRTTVKYPGTKYCPNCGAKMDEEDKQ